MDTAKSIHGCIVRAALALALAAGCSDPPPLDLDGPVADWPVYSGAHEGASFSPLTQIDRDNVERLEIAWVHHSGDASQGDADTKKTAYQARPLAIGDSLYLCTPFNRVLAIDAETGRERWSFDPELRARGGAGPYPLTCRGVAYWPGREGGDADVACAERIFTGTRDAELIALDRRTGRPCAGFGDDGRVALRDDVGEAEPWEYYPTSPPLVIDDVVVVGALVADSLRVDAPAGVVRAFDAVTGALRWAWDPVPPGWTGEPGPDGRRYAAGTPNVWSLMSADPERGLVFVPTGNASPDQFGGQRGGLDHYGSSTVALDARTGAVAWHFQTVHHDLWDYDVASPPALFELEGVGGGVAAVAQATKMGHVFLLDRDGGEPLYPVEERAVPQSPVPGETLSPTQPFPTHPPPLHPATLGVDDAWGFTPIDRKDCARRIAGLRSEGIFTPPSLEGSVLYPGAAGGANWGGVAIDPDRRMLVVNQSRAPMVVTLIPRAEMDALDPASVVYPDELYPMEGTPYGVKREALLSSFGAPCNPPPWGTLTGVDLVSGEVRWEATLGTARDQAPWPLWFANGTPNLGGLVATAGGLVFIGATTDRYLRAFDVESGAELWRHRLPYTGNSSPITYRLRRDGRQFVVIAAGGHGWSESGDALVAFALPAD